MDTGSTTHHIRLKRLSLSPLAARHKGEFVTIAGNWTVASMTADIPYPLSDNAAMQWFEHDEYDVRYAIELHGNMIGTAGYFLNSAGTGELGFMIAPEHWGKGYAQEAVRGVLEHGFTVRCMTQFTSSHFTDNPASARVLHKLGFAQTGTADAYCVARGKTLAGLSYCLTRQKWLARTRAAKGAAVEANNAEPATI